MARLDTLQRIHDLLSDAKTEILSLRKEIEHLIPDARAYRAILKILDMVPGEYPAMSRDIAYDISRGMVAVGDEITSEMNAQPTLQPLDGLLPIASYSLETKNGLYEMRAYEMPDGRIVPTAQWVGTGQKDEPYVDPYDMPAPAERAPAERDPAYPYDPNTPDHDQAIRVVELGMPAKKKSRYEQTPHPPETD